MTKSEMIKAMREMVRDLGKTIKWAYQGQWHERKVVRVTTDEVCEDYAYTEVEFTDNGKLEITDYDCEGTGCGDYADRCLESEIDKVYNKMLDLAAYENA